jgi:two-component system LytT family response regulator
MILSCIIIDDEPNAVNLLDILIHQNTQWQLKAKCYNALEALAFLKKNKVDFIFLDINMPKLSGMELAVILPAETNIVFTTAYSEYAVESYTFHTIDYLLKPITDERFLTSIQKIESYFINKHTVDVPLPLEKKEQFFVKSGRTLSRMRLDDILYFEGEREYVRLVTATKQLLIYRRLKDIEDQLSLPFIRVHNSYLVNIQHIEIFQDNQIYIGGKQIPLSEKFKDNFMNFLKQRII